MARWEETKTTMPPQAGACAGQAALQGEPSADLASASTSEQLKVVIAQMVEERNTDRRRISELEASYEELLAENTLLKSDLEDLRKRDP